MARITPWRGLPAQVQTGDSLANALVAAWGLNENGGLIAFDSSGAGYYGTLNSAPVRYPGFQGTSILFDGSTQSVATTQTNRNFAGGAVTWWQKPSVAFNSGVFRSIWGDDIAGTGANNVSAQVYTDNNWYVGWVGGGLGDRRIVLAASAANFLQDRWSCYVYTWTATGNLFFCNGVLIGSNASAPGPSNTGEGLYIGRLGRTNTSYFPGAVQDVRVYRRPLFGVDALALYTQWWRPFLAPAPMRARNTAVVVRRPLLQLI